MSYITVPSYEGNQPFIYVYYAEEDTRLALPVLARLYNEGLRMWSWNGCTHPTEVRAAQRISTCAALLIFLSDNLSRDIDRGYFEAMEALRCNKIKHFVRLSDVELPFDWGKSDTNIIIDYVRSNESAFWLSIYDSDSIERCRGAWPSKPVRTGLSAYESIDSSEVQGEYSSILRIIGESPALDRSGIPINADDIALFAGAGEEPEAAEVSEEPVVPAEVLVEDLNRKSMEDLFGMLDEISVSTRQKADELRQASEERRLAMEKAAMAKASLPFQQDVVATDHSDETPLEPELRFMNVVHWAETAAAEMFGAEHTAQITLEEPQPEEDIPAEEPPNENEEPEVIIIEEAPSAESAEEEWEEPAEPEPSPSFEEFIDELAGAANLPTDSLAAAIRENDESADAPEEPKEPEEPAESDPVYLSSGAKTVEIPEENRTPSTLLPPASGSLTGFTLPDDTYVATEYVVNDDEGDALPTAAERAAAAEESRRQFESAIEKAAYSVSGRIVARHTKSDLSVGLRVRKPKKEKTVITARVKTVKVSPTVIIREEEPVEELPLTRTERRRRRKAAEAAAAEEQTVQKVLVTPEPMRGEPPADIITEPPAPQAAPEPSAEDTEPAASRRKKRHPHNSSGLLSLLRSLRSESSTAEEEEPQQAPQSDDPSVSEENQ